MEKTRGKISSSNPFNVGKAGGATDKQVGAMEKIRGEMSSSAEISIRTSEERFSRKRLKKHNPESNAAKKENSRTWSFF